MQVPIQYSIIRTSTSLGIWKRGDEASLLVAIVKEADKKVGKFPSSALEVEIMRFVLWLMAVCLGANCSRDETYQDSGPRIS